MPLANKNRFLCLRNSASSRTCFEIAIETWFVSSGRVRVVQCSVICVRVVNVISKFEMESFKVNNSVEVIDQETG